MKRIISILVIVVLFASCKTESKKVEPASEKYKIPVHAWVGHNKDASDEDLKNNFTDLKEKGIDRLMYNGGQDPETYRRVGKIAKASGLEFHTWIPTMVQGTRPELKEEWYAINRNGESAFDKPAYTSYYQFLCPNREGVFEFLKNMYGNVADVEEVDGIHLDYIRFPDVILARGLWEKYNLVMDVEHPQFDYCYCDKCKSDFKAASGIDVDKLEDATQSQEWKQFRYDLITKMVSRLTEVVHAKNKLITAAVFPGPGSEAIKLVRQEWNKWSLDEFYPMNYNDFYAKGPEWIGTVTKEEVTASGGRPVYSGLFICPRPENKANEPDPEGHGLLPEELEAGISASMKNGAKGICLFTPGRMTDEHWKVFEKVIYTDYTK